jgi:hypothetical protein
MDRLQEFNTRLDKLVGEFSDVSCEDLADSLEYCSVTTRAKGY